MTPAARLSAAIEVIETIDGMRVPAAQALKEWGTAHRFAGSGDRAAIAGLVWDVLRRRASSAWVMDDDTPRARVLGMLKVDRAIDREGARRAGLALNAGCAGGGCRRLSGLARSLSCAGVRRAARGGSRRDGEPGAARSARQ